MDSNEESMDDNNPLIIKTFGEPELSQFGLGYELFNAMTRNRSKIAQYIVDTEEEQTFGDLLEDCVRVAINLRADEFAENDVLGLCAGNHKETCVPYIAALLLGIEVIAFDTSISVEDRVHLLQQVVPKVMFVDQKVLANIEESIKIAEVDIKLVVIGDEANGNFLFSDYLDVSEEYVDSFEPVKLESNRKTAAILFSSGTTGMPKGICLSHYGLLSQGLLLA